MLSQTRDYFVWVEKYRPQVLDDCILPSGVTEMLNGILKQGASTNLLFHGEAGVGKTTVAKALCRQLDADVLMVNASEDNGIDILRNLIRDYASTMSLTGSRKFVLLDEADYITSQAQATLRGFMEEFSQGTGFILTVNHLVKIVKPIQSRCSVVDFHIPIAERQAVMTRFAKRASDILMKENVKHSPKIVAQVVLNYFPDFRRVLNELQRFSLSGMLSEGILAQISDRDTDVLFTALKKRDFEGVRNWAVSHADASDAAFYRMLEEQVPIRLAANGNLADVIVLLADYNFRSGLCADPLLNSIAVLVELMKADWK